MTTDEGEQARRYTQKRVILAAVVSFFVAGGIAFAVGQSIGWSLLFGILVSLGGTGTSLWSIAKERRR